MRVLVVDDEPLIASGIRKLLERRGDTVVTAHSALEAVDLFRLEHFDLAIVDFQLGTTMTGLDVGKHAPRGCALVMVTGYSPEEMRGNWQDPLGGFLAVVGKPEFVDELLAIRDRVERAMEDTPAEGYRGKKP
jgi:CheY-like chemotaxis protein